MILFWNICRNHLLLGRFKSHYEGNWFETLWKVKQVVGLGRQSRLSVRQWGNSTTWPLGFLDDSVCNSVGSFMAETADWHSLFSSSELTALLLLTEGRPVSADETKPDLISLWISAGFPTMAQRPSDFFSTVTQQNISELLSVFYNTKTTFISPVSLFIKTN